MLAAVAEGFTHAADHIRIKGSRCRAGCGKTDRLDAVVDAEMVRFLILLAQAVGTVAHHGAGDSQPFHGLGMPEIVAGTQARLFLQRHLGDQSFDIHPFILLFHYSLFREICKRSHFCLYYGIRGSRLSTVYLRRRASAVCCMTSSQSSSLKYLGSSIILSRKTPSSLST